LLPRRATLPESSGAFHARIWAQYGTDHKGLVLVLDGKRFLSATESSVGPLGQLWFGPVEYVDLFDPRNVAFFLEYDEVLTTPLEQLAERIMASRTPWLFFTKHKDWSQEEEMRIIMLPRDTGDYFIPIRDALVEIVIGTDFQAADLPEVRSHAARLGCRLSQVLWRNGFPVRTPID
jgi:hypothetical protein